MYPIHELVTHSAHSEHTVSEFTQSILAQWAAMLSTLQKGIPEVHMGK